MSREYSALIKQLSNTLAKMELALGAIRESIVWTNESGLIQWCNASFDHLVGRPHIEILGSNIFKILPLNKKGKLVAEESHPVKITKEQSIPEIYEYESGNKLLYLEIKSSLFKFQHEKNTTVSILRDVTKLFLSLEEIKKSKMTAEYLAEKAIDANQLKSQFLANMSHEFRTPMNAIIGFAELIKAEAAGPLTAEQNEYLSDILTSAEHLLRLINDVLDLSKVESGKMQFYPAKIDLLKLIEEVCEILSTLAAKKRINISIKMAPNLSEIIIDSTKLKQVFYNYLSNAIKFTGEDGRIEIYACREGDKQFRIQVKDNGIGIHKDDLDKLFVEFQQLDIGASKKFQGTGLGLALTRRIVEAQGGHVGVESEERLGSTFFAVLPYISANDVKNKIIKKQLIMDQHSIDSSLELPSILVIEDEQSDQAIMVQTLMKVGCIVEVVSTGKEALERCNEKRFDAITLDLILPDITGWDVLHQLRTTGLNQQTPILVVTVIPGEIASAGFTIQDYLVKPIKSEDFIKALERIGIPNEKNSHSF